jgi:hypothetical protein
MRFVVRNRSKHRTPPPQPQPPHSPLCDTLTILATVLLNVRLSHKNTPKLSVFGLQMKWQEHKQSVLLNGQIGRLDCVVMIICIIVISIIVRNDQVVSRRLRLENGIYPAHNVAKHYKKSRHLSLQSN